MVMLRFCPLQNIAKAQRFFKLLIAVMLLSCLVTRYHVVVCALRTTFYFLNPLVSFVIGNVILILLVCIYRKNYAGWNPISNDLQYEYFQITEVSGSQEMGDETKHAVGDIGVSVSTQDQSRLQSIDEMEENTVNQVQITERAVNQVPDDLITTDSVKVHQLQRTNSELLNSQMYRLQRTNSESLNHKARAWEKHRQSEISSSAVSSFETVDKLSSKEFKHTIEAFIAKNKGYSGDRRRINYDSS